MFLSRSASVSLYVDAVAPGIATAVRVPLVVKVVPAVHTFGFAVSVELTARVPTIVGTEYTITRVVFAVLRDALT